MAITARKSKGRRRGEKGKRVGRERREGGEGGVRRLGEKLTANFVISEKQNAEGKRGNQRRGGRGAGIW